MDRRNRVLSEDMRSADRASVRDSAKKKRVKRRQRFLPLAIGTTGGVLLASAAFWFFKKQAEHVVEGRADRYDEVIMEAVHRIDDPKMHTLMEAFTSLGSHWSIGTAAGVTTIALLRRGRQNEALTVVISVGG